MRGWRLPLVGVLVAAAIVFPSLGARPAAQAPPGPALGTINFPTSAKPAAQEPFLVGTKALYNFEFDIAGPAQGSSQTTQLSFTVSRTAGFTSASQLDELSTGGTQSAFFATHASLNGSTGFVGGGGGGPVVPEPATMSLFAAGLAFVGRAYRRRKQI